MHSPLPEGFTVRPATLDDAAQVAVLFTAANAVNGYGQLHTAEGVLAEWTRPNFDPAISTQFVLAADGTAAGCAIVWDRQNPPLHPGIQWAVHPQYDTDELARGLMEWAVTRSRQAVLRCPPEARVAVGAEVKQDYRPIETLYASLGFVRVRNFLQMRIDMMEAPAPATLPAGFTLRTYRHPDDLPEVVDAYIDMFRDHYGTVERPRDDVQREWEYNIAHDDLFDPALWYLAVDDATGRIAGFVLTQPQAHYDPKAAYIDLVGVRQRFRRHGLASALLRHTFAEFWQRGPHSLTLYVDSASSSGATRLYEHVGMRIAQNYAHWDLELRPGIDLMHSA